MRFPASLLLAVALLSGLACRGRVEQGQDPGQAVWFVHATDPHLFYADEKDEKVRLHQEKLNQAAFSDLIRSLGSIPGLESRPSFLLVTGDLGLDRFGRVASPPPPSAVPVGKAPEQAAEDPVTAADRESAVNLLAETLKASPVKDVYFVLGNNDVANESATGTDLETTAAFLADVQKQIDPSGVKLHDLTSCYRHLPPGCVYDIPETNFQLIGFSTYSFKNGGESYAANQAEQEAEVRQLAGMVRQAGAQGKRVLIATHIPEIDDPYPLGQFRFRDKAPEKSRRPGWAAFSPWDVSPAVYQSWKDIVDSGTVAGVLAGHFHDSHKEIYYQPYRWATAPRERADLGKLFLAPPLSVRYQDTSPVQARGFALFRLAGDQLSRRFYWLAPGSSSFAPDPRPAGPASPKPSTAQTAQALGWLWSIGNDKGDLARAAILAIAFLAALLTVIATWEIPPPETRPSSVSRPKPEPADTASPSRPAAGASSLLSPFQGNFAKTVLSGLGGMAAVSLVDDAFWKDAGISPKAHFLVLFVAFFITVLLFSALYQGVVEALRSRVVMVHRPPQWTPRRSRNGTAWQHFLYWGRRAWSWLLSWRQALLIFLDTVFNVVQGRNQLRTAGFAKAVQNLHWAQYRVAGRVREAIDRAILNALKKKDAQRILEEMGVEPPREDADIRVNVGLLSEDGASVSYFSWERGSLGKPFDQHSVAWVSIASGKALWIKEGKRKGGEWKDIYKDEMELLKNEHGELPVKAPLRLKDYYQRRDAPDYEAFVVLPVPWSRRGEFGEYQKAGVLISFRKAAYMEALWSGLETSGKPSFDTWTGLLECSRTQPASQAARSPEGNLVENLVALAERMMESEEEAVPSAETAAGEGRVLIRDPELQAVLHQGIEVLGEALRYFSPTYFEEQILPHIQT